MRWYVTHVFPIGAFAAVSLALGNYTYLYLSVSFIQMLKAGKDPAATPSHAHAHTHAQQQRS